MKHIDLTGQRYGKLVILSQLPKEGRYYRYLCKCDCGNTIEVRSENLRSGKVKSCGCLKNAPAKNKNSDRKDAILRREYSHLKKRNRKFTDYDNVISYDEYKSIVNSPPITKKILWNESKERILIQLYPYTKPQRVADIIGVHYNTIMKKAKKLGLKKSKEFLHDVAVESGKRNINPVTPFVKGNTYGIEHRYKQGHKWHEQN